MPSCLYRCTLSHTRYHPRRHHFAYPMFLFYLDLDALDAEFSALSLVSRNRRNVYQFRDADHLQEGADNVRENLTRFLQKRGVATSLGRIHLLTMLRTWGHVFNPVSFYFVQDCAGNPLCAVAEVANTFNEQKLYLLETEKLAGSTYVDQQPKLFYISPFSELDLDLHFKLSIPHEKLSIHVNEHTREGTLNFSSSLIGESRPLTQANLLRETVRFPWLTAQVVVGIHWHALRLWLKKIPFYRKKNRPDLQQGVRPYL